MAIGAFGFFKHVISSRFETPTCQEILSRNVLLASVRGTLCSGSIALVSFLFSKSLSQEGSWRAFAPYVFKVSLASCGTFAVAAAICLYTSGRTNNPSDKKYAKTFNNRVSLFAKSSALGGLIGAAAASAIKFVASNTQIGSLAERLLFPLLGIGTAGSVLWIFLNWQNKKMENSYGYGRLT